MTKIVYLLLFLVFTGVSGCSQNDHHDFQMPGKIPIDSKRWYQLNNTSKGLGELFDGNQFQKVNTGWGTVLKHYEAWYPLVEGEQMTIDSIMMFDGEGTNEDQPMTIYAVLDNWQKLPIAVFTGMRYNEWDGPDPAHPDVFALPKPVSGIRYLIIDTWGVFPGEIEFYGAYKQPAPEKKPVKKYAPLHSFFGINAFEWDFENPANAMSLDPIRLTAVKNFTGVRHYLDWEKLEPAEDSFTYSPARNGGWNYDAIYEWCKSQDIEVLACIKTVPVWLQASYPDGQRDAESVPARFGADLNDPASYIEQARMAFQFAARYGANKNTDPRLLKVDPKPRWANDQINVVKVGLGLVKYMECDNERDKWWKGRKAYQTGREYAANLSAFYDGNKGKLGPGAGVKNADPAMKVLMAGLASANTDYVRGMIDWSREFRGLRPDGSPDLPWDIINYHYYANDADFAPGNQPTVGVAPETDKTTAIADNFIEMAHRFANDMPVWVTETGYDINDHSVQRAPVVNGRNSLETEADWILRTSLLYSRCGIQKVFFYELMDDNAANSTKYSSSGLLNPNRSRRPAADFLYQVNKLFGFYTFEKSLSQDPVVDVYTFNDQKMYVLYLPSQKGRTASYTLDLGNAGTATLYRPRPGSDNMDMETHKTVNGKTALTLTETPLFVIGN